MPTPSARELKCGRCDHTVRVEGDQEAAWDRLRSHFMKRHKRDARRIARAQKEEQES